MAVPVIRFEHESRPQWGTVRGSRVHPIAGDFATTGDFVSQVTPALAAAANGEGIELTQVKLLAPVTPNQRFVCQGANYRQHMIESGVDPDAKTYNMIFTKASSCIVPADHPVWKPPQVRFLDYEIELGLVIRRPIDAPIEVTDADLHELVAGAVIVNDYSARDIQIPQMQFYKGKSFRSFGPVGPYLCLLEPQDMPHLKNLELELKVNGEVRQRDNTRNLVYGPAETLTELSGVHDFQPGDLLSTGTPAGCALSVPSPWMQRLAALLPESLRWSMFLQVQASRTGYLKAGDVVEASIRSPDGSLDLGVQRNRVVDL